MFSIKKIGLFLLLLLVPFSFILADADKKQLRSEAGHQEKTQIQQTAVPARQFHQNTEKVDDCHDDHCEKNNDQKRYDASNPLVIVLVHKKLDQKMYDAIASCKDDASVLDILTTFKNRTDESLCTNSCDCNDDLSVEKDELPEKDDLSKEDQSNFAATNIVACSGTAIAIKGAQIIITKGSASIAGQAQMQATLTTLQAMKVLASRPEVLYVGAAVVVTVIAYKYATAQQALKMKLAADAKFATEAAALLITQADDLEQHKEKFKTILKELEQFDRITMRSILELELLSKQLFYSSVAEPIFKMIFESAIKTACPALELVGIWIAQEVVKITLWQKFKRGLFNNKKDDEDEELSKLINAAAEKMARLFHCDKKLSREEQIKHYQELIRTALVAGGSLTTTAGIVNYLENNHKGNGKNQAPFEQANNKIVHDTIVCISQLEKIGIEVSPNVSLKLTNGHNGDPWTQVLKISDSFGNTRSYAFKGGDNKPEMINEYVSNRQTYGAMIKEKPVLTEEQQYHHDKKQKILDDNRNKSLKKDNDKKAQQEKQQKKDDAHPSKQHAIKTLLPLKGSTSFQPVYTDKGALQTDKAGNPIDEKGFVWEWNAYQQKWHVHKPNTKSGHIVDPKKYPEKFHVAAHKKEKNSQSAETKSSEMSAPDPIEKPENPGCGHREPVDKDGHTLVHPMPEPEKEQSPGCGQKPDVEERTDSAHRPNPEIEKQDQQSPGCGGKQEKTPKEIKEEYFLQAGTKEKLLPSGGDYPFKAPKTKDGKIPRNKDGHYIDDKGNGWKWDPNKEEWDVQTKKGHRNVNPDGIETHPGSDPQSKSGTSKTAKENKK